MHDHEDPRAEHLGWIESALRRDHPDLPHLRLFAQSHFGPTDRVAFVVVCGVAEDPDRRRRIRSEVADLLRRLGYVVGIEPGRDVYDISPIRPGSAHEELEMLRKLRVACGA